MTAWCEQGKKCSNGRTEVRCVKCGNRYWLTPHELATWLSCAHCHGWWTYM